MSSEDVASWKLGKAPASPAVSTELPVRERQQARRASTPIPTPRGRPAASGETRTIENKVRRILQGSTASSTASARTPTASLAADVADAVMTGDHDANVTPVRVVDLTAGGDNDGNPGMSGQVSEGATAGVPETSVDGASEAGDEGKGADAAQLPPPAATSAGQPKEQEQPPDVDAEMTPHTWGPCLCPKHSGASHKTVEVESRTWPGMNKPGGVGRITKRCVVMIEIHGEEVPIQCYNVKYLLGGTEKNVRETYIRCTKADGEQEARKIMPRDYFVPTDAKTSGCRKPKPSTVASPVKPSSPKHARSVPPKKVLAENTSRLVQSAPAKKRKVLSGMTNRNSNDENKPRPTASKGSISKPRMPSHSASMPPSSSTHKRARESSHTGKATTPRKSKKTSPASPDTRRAAGAGYGCAPSPKDKKIPDLTEREVITKPPCPLSETRMAAFKLALSKVFRGDDSLRVDTFTTRMNTVIGTANFCSPPIEPFGDAEIRKGLSYLEDVENKVLVSEDVVYVI